VQADWQPTPARRVPSGGARKDPLLPPPEDPTKKCLVLDLDETLVHSSFQAVRADAGVSFFTVPVEIERSVHDINVIRRPGLDEFLRAVGSIYEVVIFTASLAKYANPVVDTIDTSRVVKHRLFREHCVFEEGNYVKDLSMLGRDLKSTIIIDNSAVSYQFQPENAIPCSNFIDDPNDTDLYELVPLLEALVGVADVTRALAKQ
jgi:RNA polymerase II subunit A small phosphatase-like protein